MFEKPAGKEFICSKTVFLSLTFFDRDEYLNSLGFKTYYSDWTGHTNKVHLKTILENYICNYEYICNK